MVFQKPTLELICSYLKNRQQSVQVNDLSSSKNRGGKPGRPGDHGPLPLPPHTHTHTFLLSKI